MVLPVYLYGHPVIRKETEEIDASYPQLKELIENMYETMYATEGIGLAAPQIGLSIRLIVIDVNPMAEYFPECADVKLTLINPVLEVLEDGDPGGGLSQSARYSRTGSPYRENPVEVAR